MATRVAPAQHQHAAIRIGAHRAKRVLEFQHHGVRQRITPRRPIERQPRHRAAARHVQRGIADHGRFLSITGGEIHGWERTTGAARGLRVLCAK